MPGGNLKTSGIKKIIFVTGGVCSGVGKGIAISSIAALLKARGVRVRVRKFDPYLNIDPGTMNPVQHGEVFVTKDGVETDLDIGHYERFTDQMSSTQDYLTTGKIYWDILKRERKGYYNGATVQVIPHVTDYIQEQLISGTDDCDVLLCEIGGTIGDIEGTPVYEAIRQMSNKDEFQTMFIHVAFLPFIQATMEFKTKPVQHSLRTLLGLGIYPNLLICRSEADNDEIHRSKQKIANTINLNVKNIFISPHATNVYEMLLMYHRTGIAENICKFFAIDDALDQARIEQYQQLADIAKNSDKTVTVAVVGKYVQLEDSYKSVAQALFYAATLAGDKLHIDWIDAEDIEANKEEAWSLVKKADGIVIPGGFGARGIDGMLSVIKYAREADKPLLGLCLGMQLIATECSRNLCGLKSSGSAEFDDYEHKIIDLIDHLMPEMQSEQTAQITKFMRLGEYQSTLKPGSDIAAFYNNTHKNERFRHRYEFNKQYCDHLNGQGLEIVAASHIHGDDVDFDNIACAKYTFIDAMKYNNKKFFMGVQCHPEFCAKPTTGHPLFNAFIRACM